jgi:penicillin-binding protein 1A
MAEEPCSSTTGPNNPTAAVAQSGSGPAEQSTPLFAKSRDAFASVGGASLSLALALRNDLYNVLRHNLTKLSDKDWLANRFTQVRASVAKYRPGPRSAANRQAANQASKKTSLLKSRFLLRGILFLAGATLLLFVGLLTWALNDVPWREIADGSLKPIVVLETADRTPLVRQGPVQGPYATRVDYPQHLVDAVLTIEDRRFYEHAGIDLKGIARALYRNFRSGQVVQGGSTITQQLIKILYLEKDRTFKRKIQEGVIAFWLEHKLDKDEILTRYLNNIYLGAGATGVPAAAQIYFDKEVRELDVGESAMLAGIIQAPSQLNPLSNPDGARRQAQLVLDSMVKFGKISNEQAVAAAASFAKLEPTKPAARLGSWFADWVIDEARELAGPYRGTIKVRVTMVPRLQQIAEKVVTETLNREGEKAGASQAAIVVMTPDGAVVAMVGGRDYGKNSFNRAATAMRQPGSVFKLFVYYAALKEGLSPFDLVDDAPIEVDGWSPENIGGEYAGRVSIAEAFARSLNAATVALAMEVGIDKVVAAARELGIDAALKETPSLALGSSEISLVDLVGAYASVRAGVAPVEPWGIASFHTDEPASSFRVGALRKVATDIRPYQNDLVGLLRLVVRRGTGRAADLGDFAAGKTGTSQNYRDAWFVGFTEPLIAGVWVGNDDETPMRGVTGGDLPARIWKDFMTAALAEPEADNFQSQEPASFSEKAQSHSCNFRACARSYRSFRPDDCTYQPYQGPRRLCEK